MGMAYQMHSMFRRKLFRNFAGIFGEAETHVKTKYPLYLIVMGIFSWLHVVFVVVVCTTILSLDCQPKSGEHELPRRPKRWQE